jgi:hypothetical protein
MRYIGLNKDRNDDDDDDDDDDDNNNNNNNNNKPISKSEKRVEKTSWLLDR